MRYWPPLGEKQLQHASCPILKMSINGVSMIISLASGLIYVPQCGYNSLTMSWQPFHLKQLMTHMLPNYKTDRQRSVNNIWSCILVNQGFTWMNELKTKLLTVFIAKNTMYNRKNLDSKIINVADCKTCKNLLLAIKNLILKINNYPTAKARTLYISTDRPAGRPADNVPNAGGLGDFHRTVLELTVRVYWPPGPRVCQRLGSYPDSDLKWWSGTFAITIYGTSHILCFYNSWHVRNLLVMELRLNKSWKSVEYIVSSYPHQTAQAQHQPYSLSKGYIPVLPCRW